MRTLKRAFRLLCLAVLIILASFGIGLSGGVAIPVSRKREDNQVTIELVESNKYDEEDDASMRGDKCNW